MGNGLRHSIHFGTSHKLVKTEKLNFWVVVISLKKKKSHRISQKVLLHEEQNMVIAGDLYVCACTQVCTLMNITTEEEGTFKKWKSIE